MDEKEVVAAAQTPDKTDLCYKTVDVEKVRALEFLQYTVATVLLGNTRSPPSCVSAGFLLASWMGGMV